MDTKRIKENVVPVLIESVGTEVINRRNKLGVAYSLKKHNPQACSYLESLTEGNKKLSIKERFAVDTYITSIKNSHVYKTVSTIIEKALENGNENTILESRTKVQELLLKYKI